MTKAQSAALAKPDAETRITEDHHQSLRLWLRLLACTKLIENELRQLLQSRFGTTTPRFDLMAQLERSAEGLKMGELTQRLMVTGGNVTGITDMLEKEGLIARETDTLDRRAFRVKLTKGGERQYRRMAAEHERWVIELFEGLSLREKAQLSELLGELKLAVAQRASPRSR